MKTIVKFTKPYRSYSKGDIAGFNAETAKGLIGKVAEAYEPDQEQNLTDVSARQLSAQNTDLIEREEALLARAELVVKGEKSLNAKKSNLAKREKLLDTRAAELDEQADALAARTAAGGAIDGGQDHPPEGGTAKLPLQGK